MSDVNVMDKTDIVMDFVQNRTTGVCTGEGKHTTRCSNQSMLDGYCDCLADAANLCVKTHDPKHWWQFSVCMFANNGAPGGHSIPGLESDDTFETTVQKCAAQLSYSFDELKVCYSGAEGEQLASVSAAKTDAAGWTHPHWLYVDGEDVGDVAHPPPYTAEELLDWADRVKAKILAADAITI